MKKRILSVLLTMAMVLSMLPVMGPAVLAAGTAEKEIDQSTYEALGLNLYSDEDTAADSVTAPFKEDGVATSIAAREVYVALNAAHGNRYTLRDGLDTVDPNIHDNTRDQHSGAYAFYGGSPSSIKAENGSTVSSGLSSNKGENVLASQGNGFNGIYATSVALDGGDGKDNYVAELRAYGDTTKTTYNSKEYGGGLKVVVFQIGDDGSRTEAATLTPKLNDSSVYSNSVAYLTRRYVQELDAYFEIEAGDLNGDGLDDLAVYTGRYKDVDGRRYALVDVFYATGSGQWQTAPSQEIAVDAGDASSYSKISYSQAWKGEIVKHPVVTIAMGDIDRNLKDEMAVVSSAPANNNDADNVAHFSLLGYEDGKLSPVGEMENVALNDGNGSGLISAGCAFGEFAQIDNESASATTLIIGGWSAGSSVITRNEASAGYSQGAYYYVYYDYTTGQYIQSGYRSKDLGGHTKSISQVFNLEGQENGGNGVRVYPTLAPMAVACGDLDGSKVQSVSDQVLFGTQVMEFSLETGFGSELFSFDFCMTQVDDKNNNRDKEQPWIGDVVVGTVDSDPSEKGWREMFLFVTGVHRKSEINTSDDYYYMDLGAIWRRETASETDAKEGYFILFEGVMAKSNARNDTYGTFVSLALPDVGNDSVVMKFVEKGIIYTDPEVFAVLQASPYFSDLEEVYGYIGNGGTSYGESQGSSTTGGASISGSYGFYHSATVQAVAAAEYEFSLVATASYDYSYSSDKETAISYNNQAGGGDKVVVYTVPNVLYIYEVYTPGTNGASGTWDQVVMTTPLQAVVTMLDVDAYDEVAASTAGLEPVRGNILYSTPGQPETYVNKPAGQQEAIYDTYAQSSSAGSGSDITQEFSFSETNEHSFSVGFDFNFKVGAGGGGLGNELMFGAMGNIAASGSGGWSRTEGTSFSGTVDALPEEATNYGFSWKLLVNRATLGGNDVWVVGYDVKDVVQPPRMPQNLTVTQVGTDYVDLEWESGGNASSYILYQKTTTGNYNQVAVLPYTAESYRHEGRNPNTTYTYAIQAISSSGVGSIYSPDVTATTMADNASFSIVEHPGDAHAHAGGSAQFEAQGSGQGGYGVVGYEWQVNETGRAADWKKLSGTGVAGASSAKLTLNNVTQEMDGWQYRCRIYYDQYELFTAPATLIVDKADSQITMSILDEDNDQVTGDTVLSAKGSVVTTGSSEVSGKKAVSVEKDGKTYTLLSGEVSGQTYYYWFDGTNYYAYAGQLPTVSDGLFGTNAVFSEANVGGQQTLTATDYTTTIKDAKDENVTLALSGPENVSADSPITIPDPEGTSEAYTATRKWTVTTGGYTGYTVYEATREVTKQDETDPVTETETFYTTDNSNYTVCTVTYTNVITVSDAITLNVSTLATAFQATSSTTTTTQTHTSEGKAYTLTAAPKAWVGSDTITGADNRVYFSISNGTSGETVEATWNEIQNCYTATWTPTLTGKLTITAVFAGNDRYLSSQSTPYTAYSTVQVDGIDTSSLSMSASANMLYGQAGTLAVTKLTVDTQSHATSADVTTNGTAYTVEKRNADGAYTTAVVNTDYTLSGGIFTPMAVGTFRITATNDSLTASAVISVSKATLTLAAQDTERAVNDNDREPAEVTITTNNGQKVSLTRGADYTVTSDGTTATIPGTYPIQAALVDTSGTVKALQTNYNIITQGATYTLTSEAYQVTAAAGANGSVSMSYQADDNSATVPVQSGTSLPEGSKVTVTATPDNGYMVSRWMVNGEYVTASGSASYYTGTTYTIDSLSEESIISVEFALGSSTLTYEAANADGTSDEIHGQVTAWYVEGGVQGNQCASGNAVNYNQTVRVAAQPDEGYAVHHWTVQKGNGEPQTLMAPDGVSYFTGESNDFSQFSENMTVTVYFTQQQTLPVTIKPVDNDGAPIVNATVTVNGDRLDWDEGETAFVYQGKTGENLTITITPPSGLLVQEWTVGENQTTGSLSNQNQTMTLYNLQAKTDFTVHCAALNTFRVTFSGAMEEGVFSDQVGTVTAAKIGTTGTGLTSGENQAQGSAILFTATAMDGYEIAGWTVNDQAVEASGAPNSQTYQIPNLSSNVNVEVTFRAKPTVTITQPANGTITVTGTVNGQSDETVNDGDYVDYGTDLTVTVTPEDSHVVTGICNTQVNADKANGVQSTTIQNVISAQTVSAELTAKPTVTIAQLANGTITVTGTVNGQSDETVNNGGYVDYGTDLTVTVTPEGSHVVTKICDTALNETKANGVQSTTIQNVTSAQTVSAELTAKPTVTIAQLANGTITVTGTVNGQSDKTVNNGGYVDYGTGLTVTVTPENSHVVTKICDTAVNEAKANGAQSTTIENVASAQTVSAELTAKPKVTITKTDNGTVTLTGTVNGVADRTVTNGGYVDFGTEVMASAVPGDGYVADTINSVAVNADKTNGAKTSALAVPDEGLTVGATFLAKPKVTITQPAGGALTVKGTVDGAEKSLSTGGYVDFASTLTATATPDDGYVVETINSKNLNEDKENGPKSDTLAVPDDGLTVGATFLAKPKVTFTQPAGGALSVKGTVDGKETSLSTGSYVDFASTLIATATPDNGYVVETINSKNLNEDKENGPKSDTLAVPDDGLTVGATFLAKPTVTIDTAAGGAVEATGTADGLEKPLVTGDYVDFGTDVEVALGPDKGYVVGNDGTDYVDEDKSDDKTYTISNIHANQSIVPIWNRLATYAIGFSVVDLTGDGQGNGGKLSAVVARKGMADYDQSISADVSGSAIVYNGGTITLTAAAESGYRVKEWTINGQVYKTNGDAYTGSTLTLTPKENQTITVQFQLGDPTVTFGDPDHGSLTAVTDAGTAFTSGGATKVAVNFTVTPDAGYEVKQWTVNGTVQKQDGQIITANTFSIKPQGDVVVAVELQGVVMNVTATAGPGGSASVSPEIVRYGDTVTFTATANTGFTFDGWYVDGSKVEDAEGTTYIVPNVTADMALEARFTATADNQVEFSVNDETMGAITATANDQPISSGDMLAGGTKVVFTVSPEAGYRVASWTGLPDDAEISADKTTATVAALPGELTVQAVLEVIPMHTVTIETPEHGAITATANGQPISSGDTVPDGTQVTFTATPDPNWIFSAWTGAAASQSDKTFTMAVTGDITVGVAFEEAIHYVVHYSVVGNAGGTLSGTADGQIVVADTDVQVVGGSKLVFTAVPDEGKAVKEWTVNGQAQDTLSNTLTIDSLSQTTTVTVEFEELVFFDLPEDTAEYTITDITKDPADYGEDREIRKGGDVTFQVAPVQGKAITTLTVNSGSASQNADGSWTVTVEDVQDDITLNVTLISGVSLIIKEPVNGTITVKRGENTLNSGAALQANDQLVITASADSGYTLKNLTVNGAAITSGGTYTVTGEEQAVTVEATFDEKPGTGGGGGGGGTGGGAGGGAGSGGNVEPGHGILVTPSDNGILLIDPDNAQDGADVTVTAEPEEGYELIHVTVTDGDGQSVTVTEQEDGSFTFVMPDSEVTVEGFFALIDSADCPRNEECPLYVYEDVNINAWYHDALHYCVDRGLMQGIGGGMFAPDMTTSRAMIVTMLYRLEGEPQITGEIDFADVPMDSWYGQAVAWAAANDIVKGYGDKTFGPEDAVTREQVVSILYRYAGYKGYNLDGKGTLNEFRDGDQVSSWATEAMLWALDKGVVSGKGDGILDPTGDATRAEIGQIFMNGIQTLPGSTHS